MYGEEYHKINSVYFRDPETKYKTFLEGYWSCPEFDYLSRVPWHWDEKVDGTNVRIHFDGESLSLGGRTDRAQLPGGIVKWYQNLLLPQVDTFRHLFDGRSATLYGEGYGAKIQKGGNYRPNQSVILFDIRAGTYWLERDNVHNIAQQIGMDVVPHVGLGPLAEAIELCRAGFTSTWGDFEAEGLVCRPVVHLNDRHGQRIITKIKCRDFR